MRARSSSSSSADNCSILRFKWRRSVSSFDSPGPRVPIPPPRRDSSLPLPTSLGAVYFNCASSTCNLPSLVFACRAKMSSISIERSRTRTSSPSPSSIFLICAGDSSRSNITSLMSLFSHSSLSSMSFPLPIQVFGFGLSSACTSFANTLPPAVSSSRSSSASEVSHSFSFMSESLSATKTALSNSCIYVTSSIQIYFTDLPE